MIKSFRMLVKIIRIIFSGEKFEIVRIDDARSLYEGYNRGIDHSRNAICIFSYDDTEIWQRTLHNVCASIWASTTWLVSQERLVLSMETGLYAVSVHGVRKIVVENVQAVDGLFVATTRKVVDTLCSDEQQFDGFHFYGLGFSFSAHLAGFLIAICNDIILAH